jgi:hypothetical protein
MLIKETLRVAKLSFNVFSDNVFHRGSCAETNSSATWRCQDVLLRDGFLEKNALGYGCASVRSVFENQRNCTWLLVPGIWQSQTFSAFKPV